MISIREELDHEIWWQVKSGNSCFWFDNWTRKGALYFTEEIIGGGGEDEIEVRDCIINGEWNKEKLLGMISEETTEYITENISPKLIEGVNDIPWWMADTSGDFSVKSAFDVLRKRKEQEAWLDNIWLKGIPFKIIFSHWRIWKGRIATEDILRKMRISLASRCYCCENFSQETMSHLFLTSLLAQKLWRLFATCAGISMKGNHLQQVIKNGGMLQHQQN